MENSRYWGEDANLAPTVQNINNYRFVDPFVDPDQDANFVTTKEHDEP